MSIVKMESLQPRWLLAGLVYEDVGIYHIGWDVIGWDAQRSNAAAAFMNAKGKLFINMEEAGLRVTQEGKTTVVAVAPYSSDPSVGTLAYLHHYRFTKVRSIEIRGTASDDMITLGSGLKTTTIFAGQGHDKIYASDEDAIIHGGEGNDTIYAGGGNDTVYGDAGDDRLYGSSGNDFLDGGSGKDVLDGGKGKNKLVGGSGTDYLFARPGKDLVIRDVKDRLIELA